MKGGAKTTPKGGHLAERVGGVTSLHKTQKQAVEAASKMLATNAKKLVSPRKKLSAKGLGWLLNRQLPPARTLSKNPVLVARKS